jgi:hypothetical protein
MSHVGSCNLPNGQPKINYSINNLFKAVIIHGSINEMTNYEVINDTIKEWVDYTIRNSEAIDQWHYQ